VTGGEERAVVVGIDGSAEADAALTFAVTEAVLRRLPLRVVCAWEPPASAYVGEAFAATSDAFVAAEHRAEDVLRAALERVPHQGVRVEAISVEGRAAGVLLEQAVGAELLVVGSRGRGATKRLLLGSVSSDVAHHAPCPVVIVPAPPREPPG
jgi:nucleotide-binding universal stress UspA family protein